MFFKSREFDMRFEGFTAVPVKYIMMNVIPCGLEEIY
jgi:hypothetical protein